MILMVQYYKSENIERDKEYITCICENARNAYISKIYVFLQDTDKKPVLHKKITYIENTKRFTYDDFFNFSNENCKNNICIIANNDIIFDNTLIHLNDFDMKNQFLCLTRWDITPRDGLKFYNEPVSQDSWIYQSPLPKELSCPIFLGVPGCDNFLAFNATKAGLITNNPSLLIKTKHLHLTGHRTYKPEERGSGFAEHLFPTKSLHVISKKEYIKL